MGHESGLCNDVQGKPPAPAVSISSLGCVQFHPRNASILHLLLVLSFWAVIEEETCELQIEEWMVGISQASILAAHLRKDGHAKLTKLNITKAS